MPAKLQQSSDLTWDLSRPQTLVSGGGDGSITWDSDFLGTVGSVTAPAIAFNPARTIGLAIVDDTEILRATAAGAWSSVNVVDQFVSADSQIAVSVAWSGALTAAIVCTNASSTWQILYTDDGGLTWQETASDLSGLGTWSGSKVAPFAFDGTSLIAVVPDTSDTYAFLMARSTDDGVTWTTGGGPASFVGNFSPQRFGRNGSSLMLVGNDTTTGVSAWAIRTDDGGDSWSTAVQFGTPTDSFITTALRVGSTWLAFVMDASVPSSFISGDNGATWTGSALTGATLIYAVQGLVISGGRIAVGAAATADACVALSDDGIALVAEAGTEPFCPTVVYDMALGFDDAIFIVATDFAFSGTNANILIGAEESTEPVYSEGNIEKDEGLETYVALCLGCDARVPDGVPFDGDRGGWWASKLLNDDWGSLLWTLRGKPNTPDNLKLAEEYSVTALKVMVDEGLASEVRATAVYHPTEWCRLKIQIRNGRAWRDVWENTLDGLLSPTTA